MLACWCWIWLTSINCQQRFCGKQHWLDQHQFRNNLHNGNFQGWIKLGVLVKAGNTLTPWFKQAQLTQQADAHCTRLSVHFLRVLPIGICIIGSVPHADFTNSQGVHMDSQCRPTESCSVCMQLLCELCFIQWTFFCLRWPRDRTFVTRYVKLLL